VHRYFFSALTSDGENANAFIDARDSAAARILYMGGAESVVGEVPTDIQVWILPPVGQSERSLEWVSDIVEVPVE